MNITFLIGNGFDRNLGLETTYSDFVKEYKKTNGSTETLKEFRAYIKDNEELWSTAEVALGEYTGQFGDGEAEAFSECHADFCEHLATYLKEQESQIDYDSARVKIEKAFSRVNKITQVFPMQEREIIDGVYSSHASETRTFNFLCYNYTGTLDKCIEIAKQNPDVLGAHRYGGSNLGHGIGQICHVHGTVDKEMVFGVNDDTQIAKPEVFVCEDGDIYKNLLVKKTANASYLENTDGRAAKILDNSNIIYIYGMSIGMTDKLWWERVCNWLAGSDSRHLIVQKYSMPSKDAFPVKYQLAERKARREISQYCNLDAKKKVAIENRIHITSENIFESIKDIGKTTKVSNDEIEEINAVVR